jgi:hypothetical protein
VRPVFVDTSEAGRYACAMASLASGASTVAPALAGPGIAKVAATKKAAIVKHVDEHKQLDQPTLEKRMTLGWPRLIGEVYALAQRQVQFETGRQGRLDGKATSLLSAAGLSLTVAFTFGGLLLANKAVLKAKIGWYYAAVSGFGVAILFGLATAAFALWALRVRGANRGVSEEAVFSEAILKRAEDETDEDVAVSEYQKSLTVHLWMIAQAQHNLHERKAKIILSGQLAFMAFMVAVAFVCVAFVGGVLLSDARSQAEPAATHEPGPGASGAPSGSAPSQAHP